MTPNDRQMIIEELNAFIVHASASLHNDLKRLSRYMYYVQFLGNTPVENAFWAKIELNNPVLILDTMDKMYRIQCEKSEILEEIFKKLQKNEL